MKQISPAQIKKIKILQRQLGISDEDYRAMLRSVAGVGSCKELVGAKIDLVIRHLERRGQGTGNREQGKQERMATDLQIKEIERLWDMVSIMPPGGRRRAALGYFLLNRFKVNSITWLTAATASRVIEGLKKMAGRAK